MSLIDLCWVVLLSLGPKIKWLCVSGPQLLPFWMLSRYLYSKINHILNTNWFSRRIGCWIDSSLNGVLWSRCHRNACQAVWNGYPAGWITNLFFRGWIRIIINNWLLCQMSWWDRFMNSEWYVIIRIYYLCSLTLTFYVDHVVHSMPASWGGSTSSATVILSTIWLDFASKRICIQRPNQSLQCFGLRTTEFFTLTDASLLQTLVWNCSSGHDVQHML